MLFRRNASNSLPMQSQVSRSTSGGASSIRLTPTAREAVKDASAETKFTYGSLIISILLCVWGWRHASYNTVKYTFDCVGDECTLQMRSRGHQYEIIEGIRRDMILNVEIVKIDSVTGKTMPYEDVEEDQQVLYAGKGKGRNKRKNKKKNKKEMRGFSYVIEFVHPETSETRRVDMNNFKGSSQSRTRARKQINKVTAYKNGHRDKLNLRETVGFTWQSILALVFGFMFFMLTLVLGQFIEPKYIYNKALVRQKQLTKLGASKRAS